MCENIIGEVEFKGAKKSLQLYQTCNKTVTSEHLVPVTVPLPSKPKAACQILKNSPNVLSPVLLAKQCDVGFWIPPASWNQPAVIVTGATHGPAG